jgi:antiviral defense system Shedu protein SduA
MDKTILRRLLTSLSPRAFDRLVTRLFNERGREPFAPLPEAGEHVFVQPLLDSYGGSLHHVFLAHHTPVELVQGFSPVLLADPSLLHSVSRVWELYRGQKGSWGMVSPHLKTARKLQAFAFLTNLSGFSREAYERSIIPEYERVAKRLRLKPGALFVGSYDSFVDLNLEGTRKAFLEFVDADAAEIRIALVNDEPSIARVSTERNLSAGVLSPRGGPLEPVYVASHDEAVLLEFEELLQRQVSESQLERFLVSHYQLIFGAKYDRIETQLWLRFPELDIGKRTRRLDVFLRNSITRDWELNELKRSSVRLTGTVRDVPRLANVVSDAIQQARNYGRLLAQSNVRQHLAREGIEYFEPTLSVVVGRKPEIPHAQWRWLVKNSTDVRLATYDELLREARLRAASRVELLKGPAKNR